MKNYRNSNQEYPPSIQTDLFSYLTEDQQSFMRPILRVIKKPAQTVLCAALLDYLEKGDTTPPTDVTIGGIFLYITSKLSPLNTQTK